MSDQVNEIDSLVYEINCAISDEISEEFCDILSYNSNGFVTQISAGNTLLWNSDEDCRKYNEHSDEYEPIKDYVIREFIKYLDDIYKVKKVLKKMQGSR